MKKELAARVIELVSVHDDIFEPYAWPGFAISCDRCWVHYTCYISYVASRATNLTNVFASGVCIAYMVYAYSIDFFQQSHTPFYHICCIYMRICIYAYIIHQPTLSITNAIQYSKEGKESRSLKALESSGLAWLLMVYFKCKLCSQHPPNNSCSWHRHYKNSTWAT